MILRIVLQLRHPHPPERPHDRVSQSWSRHQVNLRRGAQQPYEYHQLVRPAIETSLSQYPHQHPKHLDILKRQALLHIERKLLVQPIRQLAPADTFPHLEDHPSRLAVHIQEVAGVQHSQGICRVPQQRHPPPAHLKTFLLVLVQVQQAWVARPRPPMLVLSIHQLVLRLNMVTGLDNL